MSRQRPAEATSADKPSLVAVFEAEEGPLLRYAFGLVGRREVAEELVQDAFLRLHQHWDNVERPRAWLFRCVRNRAFNHLRDHKRETLSDPNLSDEVGGSGLEGKKDMGREAPDEVLGKLEAAGLVHMLLDEMDERDRELIHLKYFEGLKYSNISERTGMSIGNVGYRLHHILRSLAESLRRAGVEGAMP
ncbi:MAG: RNA polymerase sigma factor [Akkermansiaceae bacterium]|nr:RNA polymerase sigma factor [Akkermansiaceae bacterium]NNM30576.1 RNA polymerase sigma factor [Akkermansiaceae bacterium]